MQQYMKFLGFEAEDRVTGFKGVVASISFDLYGCVQVVLTPKVDKEGKPKESHWFDFKRLDITSRVPVMVPEAFAEKIAGTERGPAEKPTGRV